MYILLLIIIILYQAIVSIIDVKEMKSMQNMKITEKLRTKYYRDTLIYSWIPCIIIFVFIATTSLTFKDIGLRDINFNNNIWINIITISILVILLLLFLYQTIMFVVSKTYRIELKKVINKKMETNSYYDQIVFNVVTPKSKKEKAWWFFVSLTAGFCEEIIYRGTIIFLLQSIFPSLNIIIIVIIACAIFGLIHSYQGIKGMIKTGLIGALFAILYLITNSLILGMLYHFLFDYLQAFMIDSKDN